MKMMTLRLKPKTIFGIILIVTGVLVIAITFFSNHVKNSTDVSKTIKLQTAEAREEYLSSLGWEFNTDCTEKEVTIPKTFNETYSDYNEIQLTQGFDLSDYRGMAVTVYTYEITNYDGHEKDGTIFANLLVCNGDLIGGDVCSTSATDGFMQILEKQ